MGFKAKLPIVKVPEKWSNPHHSLLKWHCQEGQGGTSLCFPLSCGLHLSFYSRSPLREDRRVLSNQWESESRVRKIKHINAILYINNDKHNINTQAHAHTWAGMHTIVYGNNFKNRLEIILVYKFFVINILSISHNNNYNPMYPVTHGNLPHTGSLELTSF